MKLSKLKNKVVISIKTGEMIGYIKDIDLDLKSYEIKQFIVEEKNGILNLLFPKIFKGKMNPVLIKQIHSIGNDVILVNSDSIIK